MRLRNRIGDVLFTLGIVVAMGGVLLAIWMSYFAISGHHFESASLGLAIAWTGVIIAGVGVALG